jgi:hypothetical protein
MTGRRLVAEPDVPDAPGLRKLGLNKVSRDTRQVNGTKGSRGYGGAMAYVVITVIVILLMAGKVTATRNRAARQGQEVFVRFNALAGSTQRADASLGSVDDCACQRSA